MDKLFVLFSSIAPGFFVLGYGIAKCRGSWTNEALWTAFFLGAVGGIAAIAVEFGLTHVLKLSISFSSFAGAAIDATFVAALPEETIKFVVLVGVAERHVDARRIQDILALALGVSLGFATLENLFYLALSNEWQSIAMARAITAVPGHGIFGLAMGALLTAARLRPGRYGVVMALALPVLLHAAYDFPLFVLKDDPSQWWFLIAWIVLLTFSAVTAIILCNRILPKAAEADRMSGRDPRPPGSSTPLLVGATAMIVMGPLIAVAPLYVKDVQHFWIGAVLSILPVALGIDLLHTGIRPRRLRPASE
jgi:RsiW-degrading membrane proteinase PrsW (M82 family)